MSRDADQKRLTTDVTLLKDLNKKRILSLLRHESFSQSQLAQETKLTRSTISTLIKDLIQDKLVRERKETETVSTSGLGRRGLKLELNPEGAFFIGISLEAEAIRIVKLNLVAELIGTPHQKDITDIQDRTPKNMIKASLELIHQIIDPKEQEQLRGIGITVPSALGQDSTIINAPSLGSAWNNLNLLNSPKTKKMKNFLDDLNQNREESRKVQFFVENDANAGAWAEMYFSKEESMRHSLLYLFLDVGVGAGMVVNGELFRGARGEALEVDELMINPNCGSMEQNHSTFEGECNTKFLLDAYYEKKKEKIEKFSDFLKRLENDDEFAMKVVDDWSKALGLGVRQLVRILNPEKVIFGGELAELLSHKFMKKQLDVKKQLDEILKEPPDTRYCFAKDKFGLSVSKIWGKYGKYSVAIGGALVPYQSFIAESRLSNYVKGKVNA